MANVDNKCSDLTVEDLFSKSSDTLGDIVNLQAKTQRDVYGYKFEEMSLRDIMDFWHMNNHALIDEIHEATDALGGIKDGSGSAIWKKWKKDYSKFENVKFSDLSPEDQRECEFEIIDIIHFVLNYCISIGMDANKIYNLFMAKNKENIRRQKNNY